MPIAKVIPSDRFRRDFRGLSTDVRSAVEQALRDLIADPIPARRRQHRLRGHRPPIHVIDVFTNHSWQITFVLEGDTALLLRVATHREIDRAPR
ncbi:MAG: hypothetical protein KJ011_03305 [Burkholderiaceae bacterium]|nr:hypothetical protein [Burkholderiaceae bacterium]